MKSLMLYLVFSLALTFPVLSQSSTADDIADMLKTGNSNGLSGYFMNNVDLTILETDDVYSKTQATQVTKRFFDENPPSAFVVKHQGKSKLDDHYRIGTLSTENGDYRVTFFLKNHEGKYRIKQLRIESNDRDF